MGLGQRSRERSRERRFAGDLRRRGGLLFLADRSGDLERRLSVLLLLVGVFRLIVRGRLLILSRASATGLRFGDGSRVDISGNGFLSSTAGTFFFSSITSAIASLPCLGPSRLPRLLFETFSLEVFAFAGTFSVSDGGLSESVL